MNYNSILIKQNLTSKNKDKLMQIFQKNISPEDEIRIIKAPVENTNLEYIVNDNLQFNYVLFDLSDKLDKNLVLDYLNKHFITTLKQFLEHKGYGKLTKAPIYKIQTKNSIDNDLNFDENLISFGFVNLMEVDNKKTLLSPEITSDFEVYLKDKLNLLFDIDYKIMEDKEFKNMLEQAKKNAIEIENENINEPHIYFTIKASHNIDTFKKEFKQNDYKAYDLYILKDVLDKFDLEKIDLNKLYNETSLHNHLSKKEFIDILIYLEALKSGDVDDIIDFVKEEGFENARIDEYVLLLKNRYGGIYNEIESILYSSLEHPASDLSL